MNQIAMRELEHMKKYPTAKVIHLGIGDTTQPIPDLITSSMADVSTAGGWYDLYLFSIGKHFVSIRICTNFPSLHLVQSRLARLFMVSNML